MGLWDLAAGAFARDPHRMTAGRACLLAAAVLALGAAEAAAGQWVGTWAAAPQPAGASNALVLSNQTLRQVVRISVGGTGFRVRLSNAFGGRDVVVADAHAALSLNGASVPGSDRVLTFDGKRSVVIPPGAEIESDPAPLAVPALSDLAISLYFADTTVLETFHALAFDSAAVGRGDQAGRPSFPAERTPRSRYLISRVDVLSGGRAVAALGDSITDGLGSSEKVNRRWPDDLARRTGGSGLGVLNEGIGYNMVLGDQHDAHQPSVSALSRLERDALAPDAGIEYLIVFEGINDINALPANAGPDAADALLKRLLGAYALIIRKAHEKGLRVYGGTLTPMAGSGPNPNAALKLRLRERVNDCIRRPACGAPFDAAIDFDAAVRDPRDPSRLRPEYDSGDHLHPNDKGYQAMSEAVNLELFR